MNSKISFENQEYCWKKFPGFSLLFCPNQDDFEGSLIKNSLLKNKPFYQTLYEVSSEFSKNNPILSNVNQFMGLDFSSWHVTVWDGINQGNFSQLKKEDKSDFSRFMNSLKYTDIHSDIRELIEKSIRWMNSSGEIRFAFRKLYNYENKVLVVSLKPADISSLDRLHKIKLIRRNLNNYFEDRFGFTMNLRYLPHSSLGYFVNEKAGKDFRPFHDNFNALLEEKLKNITLNFNGVNLFSFSDMITFNKL